MSTQGVVIQKIYNPAENNGKHLKSSDIILRTTEDRPIIDNLVQFDDDFNSRTKKLRRGGGGWVDISDQTNS